MTRKRVKKLLMAVPGIERDRAEEISRINSHRFRLTIADAAKQDIQRYQEDRRSKE